MAGELIKREDKKAFWGIPSTTEGSQTFTRMKYFTELSGSKNPIEYSRRYIDESAESTDVTGYSSSWSFSFDEYVGDNVLEDIVNIIDNEKLGNDARREIVFVNFKKPTQNDSFEAVKRTFSVIGDSEGGSTDAYTYSGNLKVVGTMVKGTAAITTPTDGNADNVKTITFTPEG